MAHGLFDQENKRLANKLSSPGGGLAPRLPSSSGTFNRDKSLTGARKPGASIGLPSKADATKTLRNVAGDVSNIVRNVSRTFNEVPVASTPPNIPSFENSRSLVDLLNGGDGIRRGLRGPNAPISRAKTPEPAQITPPVADAGVLPGTVNEANLNTGLGFNPDLRRPERRETAPGLVIQPPDPSRNAPPVSTNPDGVRIPTAVENLDAIAAIRERDRVARQRSNLERRARALAASSVGGLTPSQLATNRRLGAGIVRRIKALDDRNAQDKELTATQAEAARRQANADRNFGLNAARFDREGRTSDRAFDQRERFQEQNIGVRRSAQEAAQRREAGARRNAVFGRIRDEAKTFFEGNPNAGGVFNPNAEAATADFINTLINNPDILQRGGLGNPDQDISSAAIQRLIQDFVAIRAGDKKAGFGGHSPDIVLGDIPDFFLPSFLERGLSPAVDTRGFISLPTQADPQVFVGPNRGLHDLGRESRETGKSIEELQQGLFR